MTAGKRRRELPELIRSGGMNLRQQVELAVRLSIPAILAQVSAVVMQYIDASMVGRLGAGEAASIGLVSTTTWLFWGFCSAVGTGFSVQVAHRIGAGDEAGARSVLRQALSVTIIFGLAMAAAGLAISGSLPRWLGAGEDIRPGASLYFSIFALSLPIFQLNHLAGSMLRCSGDMKIPSMLNVMMCMLDVLFNFLLIFPSREVSLGGLTLTLPGAGMGIAGAAWGTAIAEAVTAAAMMWFLCVKNRALGITRESGSFRPTLPCLRRAVQIGFPMGLEHTVMCGAQIVSTIIVAPLGTFAIAANSFAVTAESLCYMPGHGVAEAATTLVGQSLGAGRPDLMRRFARITVGMGMVVMTLMGAVMYFGAPTMMSIMTPHPEIISLGVGALRIEAFAEPMYAASIVAYGVFIGAGSTLVPCLMNFASMWGVRLTLALLLAPRYGLSGVWTAMCIELCFRGAIFLLRLRCGRWMPQAKEAAAPATDYK